MIFSGECDPLCDSLSHSLCLFRSFTRQPPAFLSVHFECCLGVHCLRFSFFFLFSSCFFLALSKVADDEQWASTGSRSKSPIIIYVLYFHFLLLFFLSLLLFLLFVFFLEFSLFWRFTSIVWMPLHCSSIIRHFFLPPSLLHSPPLLFFPFHFFVALFSKFKTSITVHAVIWYRFLFKMSSNVVIRSVNVNRIASHICTHFPISMTLQREPCAHKHTTFSIETESLRPMQLIYDKNLEEFVIHLFP